ncbi:hypothetical protein D1632_12385 [Chryseobacterium nematophagum]|uniref:DUF3757 domain-containing protein n=1 Tax=Chryseobacterium nematophagum TaxID=2305228 RepID=A0A3M7L6R9_9FLAO|nr:hypothetical protein [Chryseobacterium nematophagum]RMZ58413.1 hypothetical protein D1632_12385 [Chryseobacterium nematophagum]
MKIVMIIITLAFSQSAFAQSEWTHIDSSSNVDYYIKDVKKIEGSANMYSFSVKTITPPRKTRNKLGAWIYKSGKTSVDNWEINCDKKEYRMTANVSKNKAKSNKKFSEWTDISPDSDMEPLFDAVCNKK